MAMVSFSILMETFMKDIGKQIRPMALVSTSIPMELSILVNGKMISNVVKE